jgi:hypothetical protein
MRVNHIFATLSLVAFFAFVTASQALAQGVNQTGPSGAVWASFATASSAQSFCGSPASSTVVWVAGSPTSGKYYHLSDPLAGKSNGAWGCFAQVVVAGFQPGNCVAPDEMVWVVPSKKTWSAGGASGYKSGVGGYMCLTDALGVGYTQNLASGPMRLLGAASLVKCTAPDQVVWITVGQTNWVPASDSNAGKGTGGYVCQSLADLNGYKLKTAGATTADGANCKPPDVAVWVNLNDAHFFMPDSEGYKAKIGQGAFFCRADALAAHDVDASSNLIGQTAADKVHCAQGDSVVWLSLGDGKYATLHDAMAGKGDGLWMCRSYADHHHTYAKLTQWATLGDAQCPGDKVVWVLFTMQGMEYVEKGQYVSDHRGFGQYGTDGNYMCELVAQDSHYARGTSTAPQGWPAHGDTLTTLRCNALGDKLAWIIQGGSISPHTSLPLGDFFAGRVGPGDWVCAKEAAAQGYPLGQLMFLKADDAKAYCGSQEDDWVPAHLEGGFAWRDDGSYLQPTQVGYGEGTGFYTCFDLASKRFNRSQAQLKTDAAAAVALAAERAKDPLWTAPTPCGTGVQAKISFHFHMTAGDCWIDGGAISSVDLPNSAKNQTNAYGLHWQGRIYNFELAKISYILGSFDNGDSQGMVGVPGAINLNTVNGRAEYQWRKWLALKTR